MKHRLVSSNPFIQNEIENKEGTHHYKKLDRPIGIERMGQLVESNKI